MWAFLPVVVVVVGTLWGVHFRFRFRAFLARGRGFRFLGVWAGFLGAFLGVWAGFLGAFLGVWAGFLGAVHFRFLRAIRFRAIRFRAIRFLGAFLGAFLGFRAIRFLGVWAYFRTVGTVVLTTFLAHGAFLLRF